MSEVDDSFRDAFADCFRRANRAALRIVGDALAAEDVAADTMVVLYKKWPKLRDCDYVEAWVARVATNLALNYVRRRPFRCEDATVGGEFENAVTATVDVWDALRQLPRRQREAIILCKLEGFSEADAARQLNISGNSVKTHLRRGLAALQEQLNTREPVLWHA